MEANLTPAQVRTLWDLSRKYAESTWHYANCGCCVCFHPHGNTKRGWIIGADGASEYRAEAERHE